MGPESILHAIEAQDWLQPAEDGLKEGLQSIFAGDTDRGKPIENALHGVWMGHPLHPVLTDIPVGAWSVVCILDAIEAATGATKFQAGADAALNIGIAGAVGAAVTGLTDWKDISKEARRAGLVHGILNTAALGLYVASSVQRGANKRGSARFLSFMAFGISMSAAWLGGHLVYADQIGVGRTPGSKAPADFIPVAAWEDLLEGKPYQADCEGYPVVLVKKGDSVYALSDTCTHLGGPLSEGTVEGDCIRCPWHGSLFSLSNGAVEESPATRPLVTFETRVVQGKIEVRAQKR